MKSPFRTAGRPVIEAALLLSIAIACFAVSSARGEMPANAATPGVGGPSVTIDNFNFAPTTLTVAAGTTVTWANHDDMPHTIVERNQKFKSKALDTDDKFSFTFAEPGTYEYFCGLHPKMVGKVVVEAKK